MPLSADQFAKAMIAAGLSSAEEIKAFWSTLPSGSRPKDGESFGKLLIEREKLTHFQASEILSGRTTPLVLGDYVLLAKIGAGGMGQVFKAHHRRMKRLAAIKLLPNSLTKDEAATKRFEREVEAAAKLVHPNVVHTYDAGVQRGVSYLVMEYVEGRDLAGMSSLPWGQAVNYVRQAAKGLAFAHSKGIVHRDIKPANLLLDAEGTIKILDMGLARFDDQLASQEGLTQSGQVMGTVDYMAPEQAFDTHTADARADIYSLGCTFFRLLTGQNLYDADSLVKKLMFHQSKPIPQLGALRPDLPAEAIAVFERMVAKRPEDRYQTMSEVEQMLAVLEDRHDPGSGTFSRAAESSSKRYVPSALSAGPEVASAPTLNLPEVAAFESAGTQSIKNALQETDPISAHSIQVARKAKPHRSEKRPPWWQTPTALIAGGIAGLLLICFAIWVIVRDKDGKEVARFKVPEGGKAEVVGDDAIKNAGNHERPSAAPQRAIAPFTAAQAKQHQKAWAEHLGVPVEHTNTIGMKFVLIPPGEFTMGSTAEEIASAPQQLGEGEDSGWKLFPKGESPQHRVVLTRPFYFAAHEVTQERYAEIVGSNPSAMGPEGEFKDRVAGIETAQLPVETVNWDEAVAFCEKLSRKEELSPFLILQYDAANVPTTTGNGYRLPTEAEWEYVCRAGTTTTFWSGNTIDDAHRAGWTGANSQHRTHSVGESASNPFGVYDVHGNVWEWVQDGWDPAYYANFKEAAAIDPWGHISDADPRVVRGGFWATPEFRCTSGRRFAQNRLEHYSHNGIRVVLSVDAVRLAIEK